jgi:hypothetical protein
MANEDVGTEFDTRTIRLNRITFWIAWLFLAMLIATRAFGRDVSWPLWAVALLNAGNASLNMLRLPFRVSLALSALSIGIVLALMIAIIVSVARA